MFCLSKNSLSKLTHYSNPYIAELHVINLTLHIVVKNLVTAFWKTLPHVIATDSQGPLRSLAKVEPHVVRLPRSLSFCIVHMSTALLLQEAVPPPMRRIPGVGGRAKQMSVAVCRNPFGTMRSCRSSSALYTSSLSHPLHVSPAFVSPALLPLFRLTVFGHRSCTYSAPDPPPPVL